jgi:hypothetical protein
MKTAHRLTIAPLALAVFTFCSLPAHAQFKYVTNATATLTIATTPAPAKRSPFLAPSTASPPSSIGTYALYGIPATHSIHLHFRLIFFGRLPGGAFPYLGTAPSRGESPMTLQLAEILKQSFPENRNTK